ncbi:MAG: trigger factor [Pseudomonadota bacterium]
MEIKETSSDGLKRTLEVVVASTELNEKFDARMGEMSQRVELKGFRKGKVPKTHLKKVYGRAVMAEILEQAVRETSSKAIEDRGERPAQQPAIALPEDEKEIEKVINGEADLAYSMSFEVLPDIQLTDFSKLQLEKLVVETADEDVDKALDELLQNHTSFEVEEGRVASDGDQVTMDFKGSIDGELFEGGSGEDMPIVLGQRNFIPGFEEGLQGVKAGDERTLDVTFPEDYQAEHLAGKPAKFEITVKSVGKPTKPAADDDFAKTLGVDGIDTMKSMLRDRIQEQYDETARIKLKRELLDALEETHSFDLPPSLVDREFDAIWKQLTDGLEKSGKTLEDEGKTEEETRAEYRGIAERRVRLGLVIGEIGDKNKIEVTQEELRRALMEQTRRYPGQEKMIYEFYEKNPGAVAELRAPIFEDKVVDFIVELAKPTEKQVTKDELTIAVEEATES